MNSLPTIATELKKLREARGMSVRKLSKESGVSPGYISQIENGTRQTPSSELVRKLAKGLRVGEYFLLRKAGLLDLEEELEDKVEEEKEDEGDFEISSPIAEFIIMETDIEVKKTFLKKKYQETKNKLLNPDNHESLVNIYEGDTVNAGIFKVIMGSSLISVAKGYTHLDEKMHFFLTYLAEIGDFLQLLRLSKNKSVEEMAVLLNIEKNKYIDLEKSIEISSFEPYTIKIGEVLEVGNFIKWYENMIKDDHAASMAKEMQGRTHRTISFTVKSKVEKVDKHGNKYIEKYSEEELRENFFNLSCLLNQKENAVLYKNKVLTESEIKKVKMMLEVLLED